MLITFKSSASADVIMLGDDAARVIALLGKDAKDKQGIVTVEQLAAAIASLEAAIEADRARQAERTAEDEAADREAGRTGMAAPVGIAQRAWPVLEMLRTAQKEGVPVIWNSN